MSENSIDRVRISKEAREGRPAEVSPSWIEPIFRKFYNFARKWARSFSQELNEAKIEAREDELIKVVNKSFRESI